MNERNPLAIDLFCGLGGWTEGLLAEGYDVIGFDIERHRYPARAWPIFNDDGGLKSPGSNIKLGADRKRGVGRGGSFNYENECRLRDAPLTGGWIEYPAQLVIQDVRTLHGSQFKSATLIVASPPCQAYSYRAMPWKRAKALPPPCNELFNTCFRIQREACEAAGRHIPLIVENVRGAQPWVGRARWNYGSFYLWGDVPALMPMIKPRAKNPGLNWSAHADPDYRTSGKGACFRDSAIKNSGGSWFNIAHGRRAEGNDGRKTSAHPNIRNGHAHTKHLTNPGEHIKQGGDWFAEARKGGVGGTSASYGSKSPARKMASAMIAKIPLPLSRHIARTYRA